MASTGNWADLPRHLPDEVMDLLVPHGTFAEIPDLLESWYSGLCDGIVLGVPETDEHDDAFRGLVARCRHQVVERRS